MPSRRCGCTRRARRSPTRANLRRPRREWRRRSARDAACRGRRRRRSSPSLADHDLVGDAAGDASRWLSRARAGCDEQVGCRASEGSRRQVAEQAGSSRSADAGSTASMTRTWGAASRSMVDQPSVQLEASQTTGNAPSSRGLEHGRADAVGHRRVAVAIPLDDHGVPQHSASIPSGTAAGRPRARQARNAAIDAGTAIGGAEHAFDAGRQVDRIRVRPMGDGGGARAPPRGRSPLHCGTMSVPSTARAARSRRRRGRAGWPPRRRGRRIRGPGDTAPSARPRSSSPAASARSCRSARKPLDQVAGVDQHGAGGLAHAVDGARLARRRSRTPRRSSAARRRSPASPSARGRCSRRSTMRWRGVSGQVACSGRPARSSRTRRSGPPRPRPVGVSLRCSQVGVGVVADAARRG